VEGSEGGRRGPISQFHVSPWMAVPVNPSARLTRHLKLITGQRHLRFSILKGTPVAPIFKAGQAQRSMLVGELNPMGLPGETMRRMVPSKRLLINLIAAWKTASRQGGGVAVLFVKELLGRHTRTALSGVLFLCDLGEFELLHLS
jgi:hypothetical protein